MSEQEQPLSFIKNTSNVVKQQQLGQATSQIQYVSQGYCLVIGDATRALEFTAPLAATGFCIVDIDVDLIKPEKQLTDEGVAVFKVPELQLSGYLGAYSAHVPALESSQSQALDLAVSVYRESGHFDLVLDLSDTPQLPMRLAPFGYFHATTDVDIQAAVEALSELTGEFEKPRYFNYNRAVCAHSRSELSGCTRCMDVCTTGAIQSDGEGIKVDPFLCQGCGSCATVCPSGAMTYAYPRPVDAIDRTRKTLSQEQADTVVLHTEALQEATNAHSFQSNILIEDINLIKSVVVDWDRELVDVTTHAGLGISDWQEKMKRRIITSGCGQGTIFSCTVDKLYEVTLKPSSLKQSELYALIKSVGQLNDVYRVSGAVHGCGLCTATDSLMHIEDVGRHNAADAIAGRMWLQGLDGENKIFYTTGRLTSEIVMKTAFMGIPTLLSRSGVTQMGLELAQEIGMTMIARAKGRHFMIYNGKENMQFDAIPPERRAPPPTKGMKDLAS